MTGSDEMARIYVRNKGFKAEKEVRRFIEQTQLSEDGKRFWDEVLQIVILLTSEKREGRFVA